MDPDTAPVNYEFKFIDKYGNLKDIFATVQMFPGTKKSLGSLLDITDRKKMENELLQVKKLESIGILAGGIAHDFNNLLTAILGNISLAKMYVMEKEVYTHLVEVEKASLRVKDLTQQLLTFSKGGTPVKKTTSIADLIKDSANFALRGSNVKCDFFISPDLWPAEVDEGQISQVINNLIINAQQAMPNGGTIQVQCDNVTM
jgi:two-component system cell cycle sensor histidine kinase/response regulator CckA